MAENVMAYWYNLSWGVRQRTLNMDGTVTKGRVERMKDLAWNYELESASVKTKATASVARDIYGNVITKGKKGKEKVKTQKEKYIVPKLKSAQVTFKTEYQVATGTTDILGKIEEIRGMLGYVGPLVVGCEFFATDPQTGEVYMANYPRVLTIYQMQLKKIQVGSTEMDEIGRLTKATVSFTLAETQDQAIIKASLQNPSESMKKLLQLWVEDPSKVPESYWSALKVCPDPHVKAMVKQKQKDDKKKKKEEKKKLKDEVADLQRRIRAGERV